MDAADRFALVICDMQPDLLKSIPADARAALLDSIKPCIEGARANGWLIVFCGVKFPKGYANVTPKHRIYGGFQRLNAKMGDERAHWFMEGHPGAEIEPFLAPHDGDAVVWRQGHLPGAELREALRPRGITKATVVGIKASYAVQATCQALCDEGLQVYAVRECVQDDVPERLDAVLDHLLPIYAEIVTWEDFLLGIGMESFIEELRAKALPAPPSFRPAARGQGEADLHNVLFCTDCKRGGHGQLYCKYLLERPNWRTFPDEPWFQDQYWKEYYCPEGRRVVDFADEPQFSRIAMYLSGRVYLEDKTKLIDIACGHMPETFIIEKGAWIGKAPPPDDVVPKAPWFVKQADRNWGTSIRCCLHPSECLGLVDPANRYVVQQHVLDPFLTDDGRKCHVKFYLLLVGLEDGRRWNLYTYKDGYACISPHKWGSDDTSSDTQVTIIRSERLSTVKGWGAWPAGYTTCKEVAAQVVKQAVEQGKLEGRDGKKQFEIFSADFVLDTSGKAWLLEFNFDPVLRDDDRHASTDDSAMVRAALSIVLPWEQGSPGFWDFAGEFVGRSVDNGAGGEGA
mmetsp:Transcript_139210/g.444916  ORF Transcript_139210/g.444916 Transcript_139210/m.444916 type:complete len:569 (-) Transcript_139210:32-1738(-)|eukprot:CAMPEP_0203871138 /NCGR_PEP_ID=MMETSP0359-20131031/18586_1 /ASSEMBLY_ACC=CAM_ASM_000338 /TAXON_ID=268821 /ORGANISM="Scrippsiella Hangoei, Strain SHTV-5" /LENGTH=568 /DNA_ID=CAMNT_0050789809 /DNA_START=50 /DNA_END=1756 /DNA_ORIENTATION=-